MASYKKKNPRKAGELGAWMMKWVLAAAAILAAPAMAFEVDVPATDLLQRIGTLTVRDLAVGEVGMVSYPSFCTENGKLFAAGILPLAEKASSLSSVNYKFKRLPNGVFELTAEAAKDSPHPVDHWIANMALGASMAPCSMVSGLPFTVEITKVNGQSNLSALLP